MQFLTIKVLNPEEELQAFPLNQHIYLEASYDVETAVLSGSITLIRHQREQGLLRASDFYNTNIGHIKETYSTIPMSVKQEFRDGRHIIVCDPEEPLSPASLYYLFIDKNLSKEFVDLKKTVSKGPSTLELLEVDYNTLEDNTNTYTFKVTSTPSITPGANIISFQVYENGQPFRQFKINAKSGKNTIKFNGLSILVPDTAFAIDEEFELKLNTKRRGLEQNLILHIQTSVSTSVKEVQNVEPSSSVTYQDVIDYYDKLDSKSETKLGINFSEPSWEKKEFSIQYVDDNSFMLILNSLTTDQIDLNNLQYRQLPAYNRVDLKVVDLYASGDKYELEVDVLDEKTLLFTAVRV